MITVLHGDCAEKLPELATGSVDAIVTDPPYGLEFMGKEWDKFGRDTGNGYQEKPRITERGDEAGATGYRGAAGRGINYYTAGRPYQAWCEQWATECLRVLKPGGHLVAFGGTRTYHRLACAIEDAGFEIRDSLHWMYGSGFPKSLNAARVIDRRMAPGNPEPPVSAEGESWEGWGTALKPGHEPIILARKPLAGTVAANVLAHGTGALNVDGCRVGTDTTRGDRYNGKAPGGSHGDGLTGGPRSEPRAVPAGRWPPNILLTHSAECQPAGTRQVRSGSSNQGVPHGTGSGSTFLPVKESGAHYADSDGTETVEAWDCVPGCPVAELDAQSGVTKSSGGVNGGKLGARVYGAFANETIGQNAGGLGDTGGASRFFPCFRYQAKAPRKERPAVEGVNAHPTVKPLALMRWLVRLVTPPGGLVLDPFAGTGTTGEACHLEGFDCVLVERDAGYIKLIEARMGKYAQEAA